MRTTSSLMLPPGVPVINPAHPLAQGLVHLWIPGAARIHDFAGDLPTTLSPLVITKLSALGLGLSTTASAGYTYTSSNLPLLGSYSVASLVIPSIAPQSSFIRITETLYSAYYYLGLDSAGTAYEFVAANGSLGTCTGGTVTVGSPTSVVGTYNNLVETLYVDGVQVGTGPGLAPMTPEPVTLGTGSSLGALGFTGAILFVAIWNRALSPGSIALLAAKPYSYLTFPSDQISALAVPAAAPSRPFTTHRRQMPLFAPLTLGAAAWGIRGLTRNRVMRRRTFLRFGQDE